MWKWLEALEFAIDERPAPVATEDGAGGETGERAVDFVGQLGQLLAETERLSVTLKLQEREQSGSGELDKMLRRMLPVLDAFERLLSMGRDFPENDAMNNWLRSVESVYFRLKNQLEEFGLVGIEAVGHPLNLDMHEVVEYRYSPDHKPDIVIAVRQRGYALHGRLLRDAQVVVATNERS